MKRPQSSVHPSSHSGSQMLSLNSKKSYRDDSDHGDYSSDAILLDEERIMATISSKSPTKPVLERSISVAP